MNKLVQEIHVKSALCSPEVHDHYKASLAACEVIARHSLDRELAETFERICTVQDATAISLDTSWVPRRG